MDIFVAIVKYTFVAAIAVEIALIVRAVAGVAIEKARAPKPTPAAE